MNYSLKQYSYVPDFEKFKRTIKTLKPGPVPFGDLMADLEVVGALLGEKGIDYYGEVMSREGSSFSYIQNVANRYADQIIRFCLTVGWDYAYAFSVIPFEGLTSYEADVQLEGDDRKRIWINDNQGPIQTWDDFQKYNWPSDVERINFAARKMAQSVPDGMKVMAIPGGIFEWVTTLMGFVPFSYALADQPDLVDAVIGKVSDVLLKVIKDIVEEPGVGGIFMGDDWGYATNTMISSRTMRQKFIPHLKKMVDATHKAEKIFILHSCGKMYSLMDDLIEIGVDGKHSFEDKIFPVEQAYQQYGERIAILGGVDVHLLASGTEEQVRLRTRQILESCAPGGHYVLGTGNSVVNYLPLQNYLALLDEGRRWNEENWG
jgi:uroporphyrinogen decarboxylase